MENKHPDNESIDQRLSRIEQLLEKDFIEMEKGFGQRLSKMEKTLGKFNPNEQLSQLKKIEKKVGLMKAILDAEEACEYIGTSKAMLYRITSRKEIPYFKPRGKNIYFRKQDLDDWLLRNRTATVGEIMQQSKQASKINPLKR